MVPGAGLDNLLTKIRECAVEFETDYRVETERLKIERMALSEEQKPDVADGQGVKVPFIERVSLGCEVPVVGIGSDDSGEEDEPNLNEESEIREETGFQQFLEKRKLSQLSRKEHDGS